MTKRADDTRGVAPGWHSPRRWRENAALFSNGENWHEAIHKTSSSQRAKIKKMRKDASSAYARIVNHDD
jgi:fatty-acid desaturase